MKRRDLLKGLGGAAAVALIAACSSAVDSRRRPALRLLALPVLPLVQQLPRRRPLPPTGSQVSITYWGGFTGHNADVQQQLVDRFNQSQKDVKVNLENQNDYATIANKLTAAIQARNAPEVVLLSDVWWFKFYLSKALQPLDDLMKAENINPVRLRRGLLQRDGPRWQAGGAALRAQHAHLLLQQGRLGQSWPARSAGRTRGTSSTMTSRRSSSRSRRWSTRWAARRATRRGSSRVSTWAYGGLYSDPDFTIRIQEPNAVKAGEMWRSMVTDGYGQASQDPSTDFNSAAALSYLDSTADPGRTRIRGQVPGGHRVLARGPGRLRLLHGRLGHGHYRRHHGQDQAAGGHEMARVRRPAPTRSSGRRTPATCQSVRPRCRARKCRPSTRQHPNFKTTVDQLPKTRPQDSARELIPNGDEIIGKGLERITANGEPAETVFKDVAAQLETEKQSVLRSLKDLGES